MEAEGGGRGGGGRVFSLKLKKSVAKDLPFLAFSTMLSTRNGGAGGHHAETYRKSST